jgi:branched-chain amino acid transport system substrate-binding protein
MRRLTLVVGCLLFALTLAGCSSSGSSSGTHVAKIGVVAPLEKGLTQFGRGIRNSVQVAVNEANARKALAGWKFEVKAEDDSSDPTTGEAAARRLVADGNVIGVVGTYNSGVAAKVAPVLDSAGIVMISPGNTDPTLTLGADSAHPVRPHANYFRMVAADNVQGPFLAKSAFTDLKARRVAVVSETKPVSKGLADAFSADFTSRGGSVVYTKVVPDGTTDFHDVVPAIAAARPDLVFYGGEYDVGAPFAKQVFDGGVKVPVMGGDGIKDDAFIAKAGPGSEGDLASTVGQPFASVPSAKPFLDAYAAAHYADPPTDFGVYAFDAANAIIAGASQALNGKDKVTPEARRAVIGAVQAYNASGASGHVAFDKFGDPVDKVLTLYRVTGGAWKPVKTETVST